MFLLFNVFYTVGRAPPNGVCAFMTAKVEIFSENPNKNPRIIKTHPPLRTPQKNMSEVF